MGRRFTSGKMAIHLRSSETIYEGEDQKQEIISIRENLQTELNQGAILQAGLMNSIYKEGEKVGKRRV